MTVREHCRLSRSQILSVDSIGASRRRFLRNNRGRDEKETIGNGDRVESRWNSTKKRREKRAHTGRKERNCGHAEKQREKGLAGPRRENENDREKEQRTTVVRGYHELHNSWPFHNGAALGCGRADGMSFSPFAAEKTILVPILSPHDTLFPLCLPETFSSPRSVPFRASCAVSRLHKVIILRSPRWKKGKGRHKDRTHLETHFERAAASSRN